MEKLIVCWPLCPDQCNSVAVIMEKFTVCWPLCPDLCNAGSTVPPWSTWDSWSPEESVTMWPCMMLTYFLSILTCIMCFRRMAPSIWLPPTFTPCTTTKRLWVESSWSETSTLNWYFFLLVLFFVLFFVFLLKETTLMRNHPLFLGFCSNGPLGIPLVMVPIAPLFFTSFNKLFNFFFKLWY